ncbi:ATP-dependent RNA helicase TDRD9-like [Tachypleus tridentatus]|uniref:ATP-dependent RNA helicase TDRD9-like n=1 Tax=Tachypleus tridentatus TaxID=6853 RepID=UPI003FD244A9
MSLLNKSLRRSHHHLQLKCYVFKDHTVHWKYRDRGISCLGISRTVHMDRDSVNSVALDPEPQDQHERMLVASHVGLNSTGSAIVVRNTTLMPNVHGLSSIIALLFAPYAELRTDKERTCYTGALCGLGYDPGTKQSIYPDHDMELVFDTTFDCEDISAINKVRMGVNLLLGSEEELAQWAPLQIRNIQQRVKRHLQELISRNRDASRASRIQEKSSLAASA